LYSKLFRTISIPRTTRERWPTPDGDALSVERLRGNADAPRLVLFHGLEGGTHSTYVRGLLHEAQRREWWADLVLWRTCDGEPVNRTRRAYHSGASDDIDFAMKRIISERPSRPTYVLGVSLGGNVLLKWLGECGDSISACVHGAAAVSVPFDLAAASRNTERGFSRLYAKFFLATLKSKALAKLERFPGLLDAEAVRRTRTLWQFDDIVTGPLHGFASAADYYEQSSSLRFLHRVRVRTLLLNAVNDPFVPRSVLDAVSLIASENSFLTCAFPDGGGHAGFVAGPHPRLAEYWMERFVADWLAD
jgi:hypothetical protein